MKSEKSKFFSESALKGIARTTKKLGGIQIDSRLMWFFTALFVFAGSTFLAFTQKPRPNPYKAIESFDADWFNYPVERNAILRLPVINQNLNDVFALPGANKVWAVGNNSTILYSEDGGWNWEQQNIDSENLASQQQVKQDNKQLQQQLPEAISKKMNLDSQQQSSIPNQNTDDSMDLTSVYFLNENTGWAVGSGGAILYTQDGGISWNPQTSGTTGWLSSVHFTDPNNGWVAGDYGDILNTRDGGRTWNPQTIGMGWLFSVHFNDPKNGWVVGAGGRILKTQDGGITWNPQTSGITEFLFSVHFADPNNGWVVGDDGMILNTRDGGRTWNPQTSGITEFLSSVHFTDPNNGWVVCDDGMILNTRDGGRTWNPQTSGKAELLKTVHFTDPNNGWIVGEDGYILNTRDGGRTWNPQTSRTTNTLSSVHFTDPNNGWAVGDDGTILNTRDSGRTWNPQDSRTTEPLTSVHFTDPDSGWVVGYGGVILNTQDGGITWNAQTSGATEPLYSVHFTDPNNGWVVSYGGKIHITRDGGRTWEPQTSATTEPFIDPKNGWIVNEDGAILNTRDGGITWNTQTSGTNEVLSSIHFTDPNNGWVVGNSGTILTTKNGGTTWSTQTSGTTEHLFSIHFIDPNNGWIVGSCGTILNTKDGGRTWNSFRKIGRYQKYPAPKYYLSWLLIALLLVPAFKRPVKTPSDVEESVADMLVSDRPLQSGDRDDLDFGGIALGMSKFIRNENTIPPLTLAITGQWGSGKSSIMNLLKADLKKHRFQTVWFNAWHHQKEEHLLATLLENVKNQAVPPIWHPNNLLFRYRLLKIRLKRNWPLAFAALLAYSLLVGYLVTRYLNVETSVLNISKLTAALSSLKDLEGFLTSEQGIWSIIWTSAVLPLLGLGNIMRSFGVKPAKLMASMTGRFKIRDFSAQTGFRTKFDREFRDVTSALSPENLVILIDDLDRCRPKNVVEILEAVNFLVSSGGCFIVLGLDLNWIRPSIGLEFKEIAEEQLKQTSTETGNGRINDKAESDTATQERAAFAKQYLEKLINIEVPVPSPSKDQAEHLMTPKEKGHSEPLNMFNQISSELVQLVRGILPSIAFILIILFGFLGGKLLFQPPQSSSNYFTLNSQVQTEQPLASDITSLGTGSSQVESQPLTDQFEDEIVFDPGHTANLPQNLIFIPLFLIFVVAVWRLTIRPETTVKDSPGFIDALKIWSPFIRTKQNTPRSMKRFINRVRFFAMRLPEDGKQHSISSNLKASMQRMASRKSPKKKKESGNNEATLVAVSALYHFSPELIANNNDWLVINKSNTSLKRIKLPNGEYENKEELEKCLFDCIQKHKEKYTWPPNPKDLEKVINLSKGIIVKE